jgi:hypothetical protein
MKSVQRTLIATGVGCAAAIAMVPGAALAKAPRPQLAPAAPTLRTPITVTWKVKRAKKGLRYVARLSVHSAPGTELSCFHYAEAALRPTRRGYTGTFRPVGDPPVDNEPTQWCPGSALVSVIRLGPGELPPGHPGGRGVLAGARVPIVLGPGEQQPPKRPGPTVKMTVLAGSTITASAPGRPDRSSPVTGTFRGSIPGRFEPNTDVPTNFTSGGLVPSAFPADPLCPGTTAPASFDLAATSPQTLFASGDASTTLILNGAPSQLFGCGPAGPLTGTTTIPLSGHVGPKGLLELPLTGSVSGIPLPGGSTGGLAANLTVNIDLSGKD